MWRRGFLHHFLVAALQRAVALAERRHPPLAVAENLHLDVTRPIDEAFDKGAGVAEELLSQPFDAVVRLAQRRLVVTARQADAAAAGGAFQHHRVADARGGGNRLLHVLQQAGARRHRHPGQRRQLARPVLETELAHLRRRRADKGDTRRLAGVGKLGALGQKAVAGVDRLRAGGCRRRKDLVDAQVAVGGLVAAERHHPVGFGDVRRIAVGVGINRHAGDAQAFQGANGAAGDFAAVSDQYGSKHVHAPLTPAR